MVLAFLDLPVTGNQRSSPWNRSTRRELRDLAHLIMHDRLAQTSKSVKGITEDIASDRTGMTLLKAEVDARAAAMPDAISPEAMHLLTSMLKLHETTIAWSACRRMWKQ
jgi:hypothetical protein